MNLRRFSPVLTLLAVAAQAQVASFTLARASYVNIEPGPSSYFIESTFSATVQTTDPSDFDSFTISGPSPADVPQTLTKTGSSYRLYNSAGTYPEALLENYPLGGYVFSGSGGTLGNASATLHDTAAPLTSFAGFLNYDEFANLAGGQAMTIQIPSLTGRPGATHNYTVYGLYDAFDSTVLAQGVHEGTDAFSFGVGAGITRGDRAYGVYTQFFSEQVIPNAGFGGATGTIVESNNLSASFYTQPVPEPATLAAFALGFSLLRRRKLRKSV